MNASVPQIPGYRIIRRIGRGGMGDVWLAKQLKTGRPVALKFSGDDVSEKWRLQSEREAVASLNIHHPNVVATVDIGRVGGRSWIAMEYAAGGSLSDRVKKDGPLSEDAAIRTGLDAARGLREAERIGIVHRDVKPANLLFDREDRAKICDLGLVSETGDEATRFQVGTPRFMAPEQLTQDGRIDHRTDIYALGLTLWFAVTGRPAFGGRDPGDIVRQQLTVPLPDPREMRPELSEGFVRVLLRMASKDPEDRYQLWEELIIDLEHLERGESPLGAVIATARRANARRRWLVPVLLPVLIAAVIGAAALVLVPRDEDPETPAAVDSTEAEARGRLIFLEEELARGKEVATVVAGFRQLAGRYPGTQAAERALERAEEIETRAAAVHEAEFTELERAVRACVTAGEFSAARNALVDGRGRFDKSDAERLDRLEPEIEAGAKAARESAEAAFVKLLGQGDTTGARTVIDATEDTGLGGLGSWRRAATKRLDEFIERRGQELAAQAQVKYVKAVRVALLAAGEGKPEEAKAILGRAATAGGKLLADTPKIDGEILNLVEHLRLRLVRLGRDLAGKSMAVVSAGEIHVGRVASVTSEGVRFEGAGEAYALRSLDTGTVRALTSGSTIESLAALALARGDRRDVESLLEGTESPVASRMRKLAEGLPAPASAAAPAKKEGETPAAAADRLASLGAHAAAFRLDPTVKERCPGRDPEAGAALAERALDLYVMSKLVEAIDGFRAAIRKDPFDVNVRLSLARALLDLANRNRSPVLLARIEAHLDAAETFQPGLAGTKRLRDRLAGLLR